MYLRDEEEEDLEVQQFVGVITKATLCPSLFYEGNIGPAGVELTTSRMSARCSTT